MDAGADGGTGAAPSPDSSGGADGAIASRPRVIIQYSADVANRPVNGPLDNWYGATVIQSPPTAGIPARVVTPEGIPARVMGAPPAPRQ